MKRTGMGTLLAAGLPLGLAGCGLILGLDEFVDLPPCENLTRDGDETGVDCGGSCAPCPDDSGCEAGEVVPCYTGPEGTEGVSVCRAGQQVCSEDGSGFGPCEGEVGPGVEDCTVRGDEDCDGVPCSDALWVRLFGDVELQHGLAVAVDRVGDILAVGMLRGGANFGGGSLISAGQEDMFLAKFDDSGNHLWSRRFGDGNSQSAVSLAIDPRDNVIVAGSFEGTLNLDGDNLVSAGETDFFVAKFDSDGTHVWSKRFGDSLPQSPPQLAIDGDGNIALAGACRGDMNFGNGNAMSCADGTEVFLAMLSEDGTALWSKRFGQSGSLAAYAIAVDSVGSTYLGGNLYGTVDFGGGPMSGIGVGYVAKFDGFGAHVWNMYVGTDGTVEDLAIDENGDVYVGGTFKGVLDFGTPELPQPGGGRDVFVVKISSAGTFLWGRAFGSDIDDQAPQLDLGAAGDVALTCWFSGTEIDFGGQPLSGPALGLVRLSPEGEHLWSKAFAAPPSLWFQDVAVDPSSGEIVLTGHQSGEYDYGLGPIAPMGSADILLVKFAR